MFIENVFSLFSHYIDNMYKFKTKNFMFRLQQIQPTR